MVHYVIFASLSTAFFACCLPNQATGTVKVDKFYAVDDEPLCRIMGFGKLVHLLVELFSYSSGQDIFHGSLFPLLE